MLSTKKADFLSLWSKGHDLRPYNHLDNFTSHLETYRKREKEIFCKEQVLSENLLVLFSLSWKERAGKMGKECQKEEQSEGGKERIQTQNYYRIEPWHLLLGQE